MKTAAVVLAGGSGKRMGTSTPKQYLPLRGVPLICHALRTFEESFIDEIVLVVTPGDEEKCREEIVERYGFGKVKHIVAGGKERYHSVMNGVKAVSTDADYIFIHDGARALIRTEVLERALADVKEYRASVVAVPAKDTVKIADEEHFVLDTPKRTAVWQMQTPQVFEAALIREAYLRLEKQEAELLARGVEITDDAMIVELCTDARVHLVMGAYDNIKITTPEDLGYAEWILEKLCKND
ncbi:MAG: 2-C-methyl-D-erythritol 4-phosphate cytidylyltransferase [Lachnospiraceae bacterium]|nr:2-C-methyl-D-erythritol 4-phosphate cytidylyltransferase [Lachnospiraceae bacterium]